MDNNITNQDIISSGFNMILDENEEIEFISKDPAEGLPTVWIRVIRNEESTIAWYQDLEQKMEIIFELKVNDREEFLELLSMAKYGGPKV